MFNPIENKNNIEEIKDELYSRNTDAIFVKKRHALKDVKGTEKAPTAWSVEEEKPESSYQLPYTKILLGAFIFFVLALGFAFSRFFFGSNVVSGNNIDILVSGPVSVAGGEELPLDIQVKNNNNTDLKVVDLRIEYPDGTKNAADPSLDMPRTSELLGDISIGQNVRRLVKAILYGEENTQKVIKITVEYRVAGSNAIFSKEKDYNVLISSSPVNIKVSAPTEVSANQVNDFNIEITSNSVSIVKGLLLKVDYPFGFTLSSANPKPSSSDGSIFNLGDLAPGSKRSFRISGVIQGQDGEERVLKFTVGTPDKNNDKNISTALAMYTSSVAIRKSSIGLDMLINQESGDNLYINAGDKNRAGITWQNNLAEKVYDMVVKIVFTGQALDKSSINVENGRYNSLDNSVIFDKTSNSYLATVNPSDEGNMNFDFASYFPSSKSSVTFGNSSISMNITVMGTRAGSNSAGEVLYSGTKTLKISSNLKLLARGFRTVGPFENSGPFPPKADNETTYTINWTATDSFNNVTNTRVSAILPPNVKWTGYTSPDTENITYDKSTGEVVWNIGDMRSGIGSNYPAKDVYFQVSVTPSITNVGSEMNLLNESTISGIDAYSGARVGEVKNPVTTDITSDPSYVEDVGKVIK